MSVLIGRKRNRLHGYDYSKIGCYFVTLCTRNKREFFGKVEDAEMLLNNYGKVAQRFWQQIPYHYKNILLDEFIVMPNHIHGIIGIKNEVGTEHRSVPKESKKYGLLSKIIKAFKESCLKHIRRYFRDEQFAWQRSYYDHIIRSEPALYYIRQYIKDNPLKWDTDKDWDHGFIKKL